LSLLTNLEQSRITQKLRGTATDPRNEGNHLPCEEGYLPGKANAKENVF